MNRGLTREQRSVSEADDRRKRLADLNRGPLPDTDLVAELRRRIEKMGAASRDRTPARHVEPRPDAIVYRRDLPRHEPKPRRAPRTFGKPVALEEAVAGREVVSPAGSKAFVVEVRPEDLEEVQAPLSVGFKSAFLRKDSKLRPWVLHACEVESLRLDDLIFFDLETTGLSCSPLFLIGTMTWKDGGLLVRQHLARNYAEESAAISLFLDDFAGKKLLVSFNGKSYDWPYLRTRAITHGVPVSPPLAHFDLLHTCRRAWKDVLPDCRLQTLESRICHRPRYDDIPSHEIPEAYHDFVRTGNAVQIVDILRHNALDLATLADLMVRLPARQD